MARKRLNANYRQRQVPGSERSYYPYQADSPAPIMSRPEIVRLLKGGEDTFLELKSRLSNVEKITAEIIALANTAGGAIVFGVTDELRIIGVDNPETVEDELRRICSHSVQPPIFPYIKKVAFDNGRRIVVLEVLNDMRPHRTLDDRFYVRDGSTKREASREELSTIYRENSLTRFEQVPVFDVDLEEDIDESLFWSYVRSVNPGYWGESTKGFPTDVVMRDMGLAVKFLDELHPTVAGMLLFGMSDRVEQLIPNSGFTLTRYSGSTNSSSIVERLQMHGNLLRVFDSAMNFITRYADLWDSRPSRKTLEAEDSFVNGRANYHRGAVIEALTNSLVHRDWSVRDKPACMNIYDNAIEIINPAANLPLPLISLRYGIAETPNPRLKAVFTNLNYGIKTVHGGFPMLWTEAVNFAKQPPEGPAINNGEFRIKLFGF